jgi:hypothetical protein
MDGIVPNLPFDEYVKRPGVNGSLLKVVDEFSLKRAKAVIDGTLTVESDAMDFGTCFHSLLLEGRVDYAIHPETYFHPKEGEKKWIWSAGICKQWAEEQEGKIILSKAEALQVEAMVETVHNLPEMKDHLKGQRELSVFAERDGYPVKSRLDLLTDGPVIDFKKCRTAKPELFLKQALEKGYHLAGSWNMDCLRWAGDARKEFWLVAVEDKPPFDACILKFKDEAPSFLRVGRIKARAAFQRLKNAYAEDSWPSYGTHFAEDHAKPWQMQELETTA